jgi:hypothetical protein
MEKQKRGNEVEPTEAELMGGPSFVRMLFVRPSQTKNPIHT